MNISSLAIIAVLSFAAKASGDLGITPQPPDTADERLVDYHTKRSLRTTSKKSYPWNLLRSQLKDPQSLIDASTSKWANECIPEFNRGAYNPVTNPTGDRSNWALIDQDSGLCTGDLFSTFTSADPNPISDNSAISSSLAQSTVALFTPTYDDLDPGLKFVIEDENNPRSELPDKVLFPCDATDVIHAVKFASKNHLRISIKTSGHSYHGGSTRANTLLLNMRKYERYASETIVECTSEEEINFDNLNNQPCQLSLAREKTAHIRVGGGEVFADAYGAVSDWNKGLDWNEGNGNLYHLVGGNAATVSPQGWTMDGGLGATAMSRVFGFGVDQTLQYEMVLANGHHVKFGPTKWTQVDDFVVPKTLEVSGVCRLNPEERDESKWEWGKCPEPIPFDDLWFANRGGGGGWGVILSTFTILHAYPGKLNFLTLPGKQDPPFAYRQQFDVTFCLGLGNSTDDMAKINFLLRLLRQFDINFGLDPLSLDPPVDEAEAYSCASPGGTPGNRFCYGRGAEVQVEAWKAYLDVHLQDLLGLGFDSTMIETVKDCTDISPFDDYVAELEKEVDLKESQSDIISRFTDLPDDSPPPQLPSTLVLGGALLVPLSYILENVTATADQFVQTAVSPYNAFGGFTSKTSDQMNALSSAHRDAGFWYLLPEPTVVEILSAFPEFPRVSVSNNDEFFEPGGVFQTMFNLNVKAGETGDEFPAFLGLNHLGPNIRGPLKDDWTKACPENWTRKERDEKCISAQECVFGTSLLKKLEGIKKVVDKDGMFTSVIVWETTWMRIFKNLNPFRVMTYLGKDSVCVKRIKFR